MLLTVDQLFSDFTDYSIVLLIQGGNFANTNSYQGLVKTAFGTTGFLVLTAMQFMYPFIGKLLIYVLHSKSQ